MTTGPWPAYMAEYLGGIAVEVDGTVYPNVIKLKFPTSFDASFNANTGELTLTGGGSGATGATGPAGPTGATGATGPT